MKTDRFDVLQRFEVLFEGPEPSFEGFLRRRDRKQRNQRIAAGVVGIAVFAAAIMITTLDSPSDRDQTPATNGPTVAPDDAGLVGLIGLPPGGATPSTPSRGELLFGSMFGHSPGDPGRFHVYVYADGRLIWQRWGGGLDENAVARSTGLLERRLTPEGVQLVMAEVNSTRLFDHDLNLIAAPGLFFGMTEFRDGDRLVHVNWGDVGAEDVVTEMPTPEQVAALQRLDLRLADPASWLPASAWEDPEAKAYVPSRYEVCFNTARAGIELASVLASFPQPAQDLLSTWNTTHDESVDGPGAGDVWCSDVAIEEARALAQILEDAGIPENGQLLGTQMLGYVVQSGDGPIRFVVAPFLPHQR